MKKAKTKGSQVLPNATYLWETVATNFDEFQDVSVSLIICLSMCMHQDIHKILYRSNFIFNSLFSLFIQLPVIEIYILII